jgi:hypothetical protein
MERGAMGAKREIRGPGESTVNLSRRKSGSARASGIGEAEDGDDGALCRASILLHHIVNTRMVRSNGMIEQNEWCSSYGSWEFIDLIGKKIKELHTAGSNGSSIAVSFIGCIFSFMMTKYSSCLKAKAFRTRENIANCDTVFDTKTF